MTLETDELGHTRSWCGYYLLMRSSVLAVALVVAPLAAQQADPARPALSESVTTPSGLTYKFTQLGKGPKPAEGDLMVIHGIGTFTDGKEFWNTRTDGAPYEYTLGVDRVIRGFDEGMRFVREGDRIVITMTPELAYGAKGSRDIPPNSTLVFDYEILGVKPRSFVRLMRDALAAGTTDEAIARAKATPDLSSYYVSAPSVQLVANAANRKQAGDNEKVLTFGLTLLPNAYQLHQALGRVQTQRKATAEAIKSYEAAIKLNPGKTPPEIRDRETAVKALDDLTKG
jgi:peptidylprolyl isomerase